MRLDYPAIVQVLGKAGWPADAVVVATAVAMAESGGVVEAVNTANSNGTWDYGLMQINSVHTTDGRSLSGGGPYNPSLLLSDPIYNAKAGLSIYRSAGDRFTPWATFNDDLHLPYMADAAAAVDGTYAPAPETGVVNAPRDSCPEHVRPVMVVEIVIRPRGGTVVIPRAQATPRQLAAQSAYEWVE